MKTAAERKRDERTRMRADGYVLRQVWVKPKHWAQVQRYIARLSQQSNPGGVK